MTNDPLDTDAETDRAATEREAAVIGGFRFPATRPAEAEEPTPVPSDSSDEHAAVDVAVDRNRNLDRMAPGRRRRSERRFGVPSRRTFLKGTGAVATAATLVETVDTAAGAVPDRAPAAARTITDTTQSLVQAQPTLCGAGAITFDDQASDGRSVTVASVTLENGGFVDVHDDTIDGGDMADYVDSVIGVSAYLEPGTHENVQISLFDVPGATFDRTTLEGEQTLTAMPHHDTDADQTYDFVRLNGAEDRAYLADDGSRVSDSAVITVADAPPQQVLTIEGVNRVARYEFSVSGTIEKSTAFGGSIQPNDTITADGETAAGRVSTGRDSYAFTGDITDIRITGPVNLLLDGQPVSEADFLPGRLTLEAAGSPARYDLTVSGGLAKSGDFGATINANDTIDGSSASGRVANGGRDTYAFGGDIVDVGFNRDVDLLLDGDPATLADVLPSTLTIEATGSPARYDFSVSGTLANSTDFGGTTQTNDVVSGSSASGRVAGTGRDSYAFSGEITDFSATRDVTLYVDGEEVSTASPNVLTIIARGSRATYSLTAGGPVAKSTAFDATVNSNDTVSANSASGSVANTGRDSYLYAGEISDFSSEGDVALLRNGGRIRPDQL